ncbi:HAMP domain-containing histidine kinase [Microbispora sp. RL4-1S]|uniref:histidine kinase n=1 Tax=Microbispora oryzae TaxID=2806554 RepID=A0A940WQS1_9ACTN|nr:HAMP domain-containing sensor histidine kinase [Microbispora oryzae]MBP2707568.1 HAMP domain-containing histidine kinase [Microbispora oryzae]
MIPKGTFPRSAQGSRLSYAARFWPGTRPGGLSLRGRLLLIAMALLFAGLSVSGAVAVTTLRSHLIHRVDQQLAPIAALMSRVSPDLFALRDPARRQPVTLPGLDMIDQAYVAYLAADGTLRDDAGAGQPKVATIPRIPRLDTAAVARLGGQPFDVPPSEGRGDWRAVALPLDQMIRPPAGIAAGDGSVVVAVSLAGVRSTVGRLTIVCAVTATLLMICLAMVGRFAMGRGLRPLREIQETAAAVAAGDLSRRVPAPASATTEIGRLAGGLNGMFAQLESAFAERERSEARMRRFVADVSHELRTPLFGIKGFAELHRMGGLTDATRTLRRIESEADRLGRLVEDLLLLARLDEGDDALPMDLAPMDLRTLAADALHDLRALDAARPVALTGPDGGLPGEAQVVGDEARLRQVVSNLVGNAVTHTPPGTPVRLGVGRVGDDGVLVVADNGPGLPPEEAAKVFDRFYRTDDSRTRTGGAGAGLGLAIVQSIVAAHGGRVELSTEPGQGAAFRVVIPGRRPPDDSPRDES